MCISKQSKKKGISVCEIPCGLKHSEDLSEYCLQTWKNNILHAFSLSGTVVVAINKPVSKLPRIAELLSDFMAKLVMMVVKSEHIEELLIEGGATASCILKYLGWNEFTPVGEIVLGVVRMQVNRHSHICITVKPGSYPWPKNLNF